MTFRGWAVGLAAAGLFAAGLAPPAPASAAEPLCGTSPPDAPTAVVAAPSESVSDVTEAGGVHLVYLEGDESFASPTPLVTAETLGRIPDDGERFGASVVQGFDEDLCPIVVVGAPGWNDGRGRVFVIKLTSSGFDTTVLRQGANDVGGTAEPGDGFGTSLAWGEATDGRAWLAVGSPGEDLGSGDDQLVDAGMIQLFDTAGLDAWGASDYDITQDTAGIPGSAESGDEFGAALSVTSYGDGLAAGAPGEAIGTVKRAGGVTLVAAANGEFPLAGRNLGLSQNSKGVPGTVEKGDQFGASIATDLGVESFLVIGVPGEDIGSVSNAGAVVLRYPNGSYGSVVQGSNGFDGKAEKGDRFGSTLMSAGYTVFVGVPGENVGSIADAGAVQVLPRADVSPAKVSGKTDFVTTEKSQGVVGAAEPHERFGAALTSASSRLWVGAPGEAVKGNADAGGLYRFTVRNSRLDFIDYTTQNSPGWGSKAGVGDSFGGSLTSTRL